MPKQRIMRDNFRQKKYHRQPGETVEEFGFFSKYRSLPKEERDDFEKMAESFKLEEPEIARLYIEHEWYTRAAAFDHETEKQITYRKLRQLKKLEERQGWVGQMAQKLGSDQLKTLVDKKETDPDFELSLSQVQSLCDFGFKHERTALGEASEIMQIKGELNSPQDNDGTELDFSLLSDEELYLYRTLRNKAKGLGDEDEEN